jgi:arylsulfatase A-like enzyme
MVFDEFDFRVAFSQRPKSVKLPQIDRLAGESLFANNAYPPAGETLLSMPALITGKLVSEAHRVGPDKLMIKYGDDMPAVSWETQSNIFSRAREAGFNTALFGWYHPYCRILGNNLTNCAWTCQMPVYEIERVLRGDEALVSNSSSGLLHSILEHARTAAFTVPLVAPVFRSTLDVADLERKKHVFDFNDTYRRTVEAANNPDSGLILTHWTIPHPPNIFDRSSHQISVTPNHSYLDNLELVDETLGRIRESMEAHGTWEDTVIMVTSDHWWRQSWREKQPWTTEDESAMGNSLDRRIPFILKMPGRGNERILYEAPFNTVLSYDLLLAILQGEVTDTKGAARWLDQHRSIARSPYDERTFR